MSAFTSELKLKPLPDDIRWALLEKFEYYLGDTDSGISIKVPKGFVTDLCSVPQCLWFVLPPWGRYGKAAVLHDFLYRDQRFARILCDAMFFESMTVLNVVPWKKWFLYISVRLLGAASYERWTKAKEDNNGRV